MEKFKKELYNSLIFGGIYCVLIVILNALAIIFDINDEATMFTLGFSVGIGAVIISFMVKYYRALENEELLKKLYIEENDERLKHINTKIGGTGINIFILLLVLAMLISNYFNKTIFFTLLAVTLSVVGIKIILKLYYSKVI